MKRFFRSAAFPILIVIVLAFFAQRLIGTNETEEAKTYTDFKAQVENSPDSIESVTFQQKDQTLTVIGADAENTEYTVGYLPETEEALLNGFRARTSTRRSRASAAGASSQCSPTSSPSCSSSASGCS